ncbi:putative quinol monooxygenase [Nitrosopumilus sp.]|uniref:putative quinol monooxygenase n=1 Tax=Nitrosopumilus sp. TaxID=2024843 RepID=UPI003D0ECC34
MSGQIHIQGEFIIKKGKSGEFKKLIKKMSKSVQINEPDTLHYHFYLDENDSRCIVYEKYTDSKATLAHHNGIASQTILPQIFKISKLNRLEVYGKPSKELKKLLGTFDAKIYRFVTGFAR